MRVRVYPLRNRGRRLERPENLDGVPGDLRMYSQVHGAAYVQEWRCVLE